MDAHDFITEARANAAKQQARAAAHKIAIAELRLDQIKNNRQLKDHQPAAERNLAQARAVLESVAAKLQEIQTNTPDVP